MSQTFPYAVRKLGLVAVDMYKIIEQVLRCEPSMPTSIVRYLNGIEERVLESAAWASDSPIWRQLRDTPLSRDVVRQLCSWSLTFGSSRSLAASSGRGDLSDATAFAGEAVAAAVTVVQVADDVGVSNNSTTSNNNNNNVNNNKNVDTNKRIHDDDDDDGNDEVDGGRAAKRSKLGSAESNISTPNPLASPSKRDSNKPSQVIVLHFLIVGFRAFIDCLIGWFFAMSND